MSTAQQVAQYLPYLRRYARALCGTQQAGDAYVSATLEALVAEPALLQSSDNSKIGLYNVFSRLWNSLETNTNHAARLSGVGTTHNMNLNAITPLPRQAFLLTSMEGFSTIDAANILQISPDQLTTLVTEAGKEMGAQISTDVLIIEDEPLIAIDLESLVESLGHNVTAVARTHTEALHAVKEHSKPGMILADIQLADGSSGLDAVNDLLATMDVPVIFITAYPERLLTGERPEPAFLLTKPYNPQTLSAIISQALFFQQKAGIRSAA